MMYCGNTTHPISGNELLRIYSEIGSMIYSSILLRNAHYREGLRPVGSSACGGRGGRGDTHVTECEFLRFFSPMEPSRFLYEWIDGWIDR